MVSNQKPIAPRYRSLSRESPGSWTGSQYYGSGFISFQSEFAGGKAICKMSKTQLKLFGITTNGKCVNGVPYSDPTQFLSAL
jgi:hypothetical protein